MSFTILNSLICDDVRREIGGKDILVGVNGYEVLTTSLPVRMSLCLWMEIAATQLGDLLIEIRVLVEGVGNTGFGIKVAVNDLQPFSVFTAASEIVLHASSTIEFMVRAVGEGEWRLARALRVGTGPLPSA